MGENLSDEVLNKSLFMHPLSLPSSTWLGHIPFAAWLVAVLRPEVLVELGAYRGASYLAFCQAVAENQLSTKCAAVDTWLGDKHSGFYGDDIFNRFKEMHDRYYTSFSRLLRMTFDDAVALFDAASVDLLHIDGLHTYDAARHDFETWLPKMSPRGIVLFHDIAVREKDFGVWKLWDELCSKYKYLQFDHSCGLGVLLVGREVPVTLAAIADNWSHERGILLKLAFEGLGRKIQAEYDLSIQRQVNEVLLNDISLVKSQLAEVTSQICTMQQSRSWKLTKPLRYLAGLFR